MSHAFLHLENSCFTEGSTSYMEDIAPSSTFERNLALRGVPLQSTLCHFCASQEEFSEYFFFLCQMTYKIWCTCMHWIAKWKFCPTWNCVHAILATGGCHFEEKSKWGENGDLGSYYLEHLWERNNCILDQGCLAVKNWFRKLCSTYGYGLKIWCFVMSSPLHSAKQTYYLSYGGHGRIKANGI